MYQHTVKNRFLKYVTIDTTADPNSDSFPSSMKQKDLARVLVEELHSIGVTNAEMDEWGYVYATIKSNSTKNDITKICFCAHMDTAPDCSGTNVKPIVHEKWDGSGYPNGIKGEEISVEGRIVAIADVFDALTSKRPYKEAWNVEKTVLHMQEQAGTHFDPALIELFVKNLDDIIAIKNANQES